MTGFFQFESASKQIRVASVHHGLIWRIMDDVDKRNVAFLQRPVL